MSQADRRAIDDAALRDVVFERIRSSRYEGLLATAEVLLIINQRIGEVISLLENLLDEVRREQTDHSPDVALDKSTRGLVR